MPRWLVVLALGTGCAQRPVPATPEVVRGGATDSGGRGCGERLGQIQYAMRRVRGTAGVTPLLAYARLELDEEGQQQLAEIAARMVAEPGLELEVGVHMDPATRSTVAAEVVRERLAELGEHVVYELRSQVRPDRVGLVVYGMPGGPPDGAQQGSWVAFTLRCAGPADRDHDGVADADDRCADEPEDVDWFEDGDGCVDRDNDQDGVLDAHTWDGTRWTNCDGKLEHGEPRDCRDLPEDLDGIEDEDGCPDVLMLDCAYIRGHVNYDPSSLKFAPEAVDAALAEIQQWASRWAVEDASKRLWIDGHTGSMRDKRKARALSERAATRVRDELVRRGLSADTLVVRPFADFVPIASERTPEGRRQNFRVDVTWEYCGTGAVPLCR